MVNNTKYGSGALQNNTGNNNTAIGAYAAYNNLDASSNTAVGSNSSRFNTTGEFNTALGSASLCRNATGSRNIAIGSNALGGQSGESVGDQNVAVGVRALFVNSGDSNTAIGTYAALGVTGSSYNTFLGANTTFDNLENAYEYSTAIGYGAKIDASNQIMMGGTGAGSYPNVIIPGQAFLPGFLNTGDETQIVPKSYIDTVAAGLQPTQTCVCATTSNITLSSTPTTLPLPSSTDGFDLSNNLIDGSYNILVVNQDASNIITLTSSIQNGVWILYKTGSTGIWSRPIAPQPMRIGYDAVGAFSFIEQGTSYGKTALVQIYKDGLTGLASVGTDPLQYQKLYQLQFQAGQGLNTTIANNGGTILNVDTSLNFINYLDSTLGVTGASGTLNIGNNTIQTIIGPTGATRKPVMFTSGITGPTGSFTYLTTSQDATINKVTVGLGNGNYANNIVIGTNFGNGNTGGQSIGIGAGALSSMTGGQENIAVGPLSMQFLTNATGNVGLGYKTLNQNKTANNNVAIGNFTGVNTLSSNNTLLGSSADIDVSTNAWTYSTALGSNAKITASYQIMLGGLNSGIYPQVVAPGGITGPTGSFQDLIVTNQIKAPGGITGATGSFKDLIVTNQIKAPGGITGPTGSFQDLIVTNQIKALGGITGPTGSFTYLTTSKDAIINTLTVGLGSGNINTNTVVGYSALSSNSNSANITAIGFQSQRISDASDNTSVGYQSLYKNTTGTPNDAFGSGALYNNVTGSTNVAIGFQSLYSDVSGNNNTAIGYQSQRFSTASENTSVGYRSLYANTTGTPNDAFGKWALTANLNGKQNVAMGYRSLNSNQSGNNNTAIGYESQYNSKASNNTSVGSRSLFKNTTGIQNDAFGLSALQENTIGSNNVAMGYYALFNDASGNNNTAIGYNSQYNNKTSNNTSLGYSSGYNCVDGSQNTFIGANADIDVSANHWSYSTALGYNAKITNNNQIKLGGLNAGVYPQVVAPGGITGATGSFTYLSSSNNTYLATNINTSVGIGKFVTDASYILDVSGNGRFNGSVRANTFQTESDHRIKDSVIPLNNSFIVDKLIPVTYKNIKTDKQDIGLIAHELQEHYPYLVNGEKDGKEYQTVNYTGLIGILIKEVKDLKERVTKLENNVIEH
jgi:hypothetical protein